MRIFPRSILCKSYGGHTTRTIQTKISQTICVVALIIENKDVRLFAGPFVIITTNIDRKIGSFDGYINRRMDGEKKKSGKLPGWSKALIILLIIVIVIIVLVLIIVLVIRGAATTVSENLKNGVGEQCTSTLNCAQGLECRSDKCAVPYCGKPTLSASNIVQNGMAFDVTFTMGTLTGVQMFVIYIGLNDGFDPATESEVSFVATGLNYVAENVPADTTFYARALAIGDKCATSVANYSEQITVTTGSLV